MAGRWVGGCFGGVGVLCFEYVCVHANTGLLTRREARDGDRTRGSPELPNQRAPPLLPIPTRTQTPQLAALLELERHFCWASGRSG